MTTIVRQQNGWRTTWACLAGLFLLAGNCQAQDKIELTGTWHYTDGGHTVSMRQVGTEIWWVGRSSDGGKSWTHSFHGHIKDKQLIGTWADVPEGINRNTGTVKLNLIIEGNKVTKITDPAGEFNLQRNKPKK